MHVAHGSIVKNLGLTLILLQRSSSHYCTRPYLCMEVPTPSRECTVWLRACFEHVILGTNFHPTFRQESFKLLVSNTSPYLLHSLGLTLAS